MIEETGRSDHRTTRGFKTHTRTHTHTEKEARDAGTTTTTTHPGHYDSSGKKSFLQIATVSAGVADSMAWPMVFSDE